MHPKPEATGIAGADPVSPQLDRRAGARGEPGAEGARKGQHPSQLQLLSCRDSQTVLCEQGERKMGKKHLVFIEMNRGVAGLEYIKAAMELDLVLTLITFKPEHYLSLADRLNVSMCGVFNNVITTDTHHDVETLTDQLKHYNKIHKIDTIFGSYDLEMVEAAKISKRLGLRGTNPIAVELCRNKYLMRRALSEHGIPTPQFFLVNDLNEAVNAASELGYPCVLKPVDGQGSEGVRLINSPDEFREPFKLHNENPIYWRGVKKIPQLLVEEYMEGPLISVETVGDGSNIHVLGLTDRELSPLPYFAELFASFPVSVPEEAQIVKATLDALDAIRYDFGPAHTELVVTKEGPRIIEINPRIVGGTISLIMNYCRGKSIHKEILKLYLGLEADFGLFNEGYGVFRQIVSKRSGIIDQITGSDSIFKLPGIIECEIEKNPGDYVTSDVMQNMDAIGHVTSYAGSRDDALDYANKAVKSIDVILK